MTKAKSGSPPPEDSEEIIGARLDRALRRAFTMPPKPHHTSAKKSRSKKKPRSKKAE